MIGPRAAGLKFDARDTLGATSAAQETNSRNEGFVVTSGPRGRRLENATLHRCTPYGNSGTVRAPDWQATFQPLSSRFRSHFERVGRALCRTTSWRRRHGESLRIPCINAGETLPPRYLPSASASRAKLAAGPSGAVSVKKASSFGQSRIASSIAGSLPGA